MNEINKQYFNTRNTHKKNLRKGSWVIWAVVAILAVFWIVREISRQVNEPVTEDEIQQKTEGFIKSHSDTNFVSTDKDFQIKILEGLHYGVVSDDMPLMIMSKDTTNLVVFVKRTSTDMNVESLVEQWESQIQKTDSTYSFSEVEKQSYNNLRKEYANVELSKSGYRYKGSILLIQQNMEIYIIQGVIRDDCWEAKRHEIQQMIESFKIL